MAITIFTEVLLTACKSDDQNVIRIERIPAEDLDENMIFHLGFGDMDDIVIAKPTNGKMRW